MKKTLVASVAALALMASFVMVPSPALAASGPHAALCVGGEANDRFETQTAHVGVPVLGTVPVTLCVNLSPNAIGEWLTGISEDLAEAEPPSEPDVQSALDRIANFDPNNPFAAEQLVFGLCDDFRIETHCSATTGGALRTPVPLGNLELEHSSGSCFSGEQSGTGSYLARRSANYALDYTIDYASLGGQIGVISGTAENSAPFDPNNGQITELNGLYLPSCGSGAKVALIHIG